MRQAMLLRQGALYLMLVAAAVCVSCDDDDGSLESAGAQLALTVTPGLICLNLDSTGTADVDAVLTGPGGEAQEGVEVTFATTGGDFVDPDTDTTDAMGLAETTFTSTVPDTYTLTASGATLDAALVVVVMDAPTDSHMLSAADAVVDTDCSEAITLTGTLTDSAMMPLAGVVVTFEIVASPTPTPPTLTGSFSPLAVATNSLGAYMTMFTLDAMECAASCAAGADCTITVRAIAECAPSNEVTITETVM